MEQQGREGRASVPLFLFYNPALNCLTDKPKGGMFVQTFGGVVKEYRCTMPENYPSPYEGFKNPMVRQGHYIDAENEEEAAQVMFERYPSLKVVDVQLFEKGKTSPQITRVNRS